MRKTIAFSILVSMFLLSGCFGLFQKEDKKHAADTSTVPTTPEQPSHTGQATIPEPPSFQDGDYYLQAVSSQSLELCEKISHEKLKVRCRTDVKSLQAP